METINNTNVKDYFVNGNWTINGSMKADKDSTEAKPFILNVKFSNVPVVDIINKALDPTKIQWVNGPGRTNYDKWVKNQTINIDFKSPGKTQIDPEVAMMSKLASMAPEDAQTYLKELLAKAGK